MKTVLMLASLAGAAWAQEPPASEKPQKLKPTDRPPEVAVRGGLELSYDDNILDLSHKQIDELRGGTKPYKYRIDEPEDFVYAPWVDLELKGRLFAAPAALGLKVQPHAYPESSVANYEEYELSLKQDFGKHEAGIEYAVEWDRYHRELKVAPKVWDSAYYTEHALEFFTRHKVAAGTTVRPYLGLMLRDFESPFQYRDQRGYYLGLRPSVEILPGWKIFLGYEYKSVEAAADSTQPDTSYVQHEIEPGTSVELWGRRLEILLRHRVGFREYTTGNSPLVDPSHADREDDRQRTLLEVRVRVGPAWTLEAGYARWVDTSDRPFDVGDTDEEVGSERQVFTVGASFQF